jgi:hypothetical protein
MSASGLPHRHLAIPMKRGRHSERFCRLRSGAQEPSPPSPTFLISELADDTTLSLPTRSSIHGCIRCKNACRFVALTRVERGLYTREQMLDKCCRSERKCKKCNRTEVSNRVSSNELHAVSPFGRGRSECRSVALAFLTKAIALGAGKCDDQFVILYTMVSQGSSQGVALG